MSHELRAAMASLNAGGRLHYWRTSSGSEVDLIWTRGERSLRIEIKAVSTWRPKYSTALKGLAEQGVVKHAHCVYTGAAEGKDGPVRVWPLTSFLRELTKGAIFARYRWAA